MNEETYKIKFNPGVDSAKILTEKEFTINELKSLLTSKKINQQTPVWNVETNGWSSLGAHPKLKAALFPELESAPVATAKPSLKLKQTPQAESSVAEAIIKSKDIDSSKKLRKAMLPAINCRFIAFLSVACLLIIANLALLFLHAGEFKAIGQTLLNKEWGALIHYPYLILILINFIGILGLFSPIDQAVLFIRFTGIVTGGYLSTLGWLGDMPILMIGGLTTALSCWTYGAFFNSETNWQLLIPKGLSIFSIMTLGMFISSHLL